MSIQDEITKLERYDKPQLETTLQEVKITHISWQEKADEAKRRALEENSQLQVAQLSQMEQLSKQLAQLLNAHDEQISILKNEQKNKLNALTAVRNQTQEQLRLEKEEKLEEFEQKKQEIAKQKYAALKGQGIDDALISSLEKQREGILAQLETINSIEKNKEFIELSHYLKDNFIDKLDLFESELNAVNQLVKQGDLEFKQQKEQYESQRNGLAAERDNSKEKLISYQKEVKHYKESFYDSKLYLLFEKDIKKGEGHETEKTITVLIQALYNKDREVNEEFNELREGINAFVGGFTNKDNHFGFKIGSNASSIECERFAKALRDFVNQDRISTSVIEVNKSRSILINLITSQVNALTNQIGKIDTAVKRMEKDIENSGFIQNKLIIYFKIRLEPTENKVLKQLQKIVEFKEEHHSVIGEQTLFNQHEVAKQKVDSKSAALLDELLDRINEESQRELRVQDIFELEFDFHDGRNQKNKIRNIEDIGSEGTTVLMKVCIYISLLNFFLKKSSGQCFMHCIVDEVGKIYAPYLKELLKFAQERNIYLVNGLPNESKLETHYRYTYQLRNDENTLRISPLLTVLINPQ